MRKLGLYASIFAMLFLVGCETIQNSGTKQTIGGVSGAVLGGIAGAQLGKGDGRLIMTGVGALLGALVGSEVGRSLDKADLAYAQSANQRAHTAPVGQAVSWNNPESGNSGTVTPKRDGYSSSGRYCREYEQTITVDGKAETAVGTACQNNDGTWETLS